jgi:NitT/TauT family transport system permease protein
LPSPGIVLGRFLEMVQNGQLGTGLAVTLGRIVAGFSLAVCLGMGVGLAMVSFRRFGRAVNSFSVGLQSFPSIAWVPFAILLVGLNDLGIIFVMVISSVFSMMVSTYGGIRNIPPIYVKAARNMGTGGVSLFTTVMLPASLPSLITGLRQVWSFAWHALIGAEILMAGVGLGALLEFGAEFVRMDQIIASMVTIFAIGLVTDRLVFSRLEERIRVKRGLVQARG